MRLIALLASIFLASPALADRVTLPGTTISLEAPDGFVLAPDFLGLQNEETGATFLLSVMPAEAAAQVVPIFADLTQARPALAPQGISLNGAEGLTAPGASLALHGTQIVGDIAYDKWLSIYDAEQLVLMTYQAPAGRTDPSAVLAAFNSVEIGPELSLAERLAPLPFQLGETGSMRVVRIVSQSLMLTIGPLDTDPTLEQPILIVAPSLGPAYEGEIDVDDASRDLLESIEGFTIGLIERSEPAEVAGWAGTRMEALATEVGSGRPVRIGQWVGFSEGRYLRVVAYAKPVRWDALVGEFETVVAGLTRGAE
ncbi:MAG: hypothetical protein AAF568_06430 [Pseudomonadota bacterium]